MLTRRVSQGMLTTMSRLSWSSCEMPFSTLKWCCSVPRHQVLSSVKPKIVQTIRIRTVHWPPRRVGVV